MFGRSWPPGRRPPPPARARDRRVLITLAVLTALPALAMLQVVHSRGETSLVDFALRLAQLEGDGHTPPAYDLCIAALLRRAVVKVDGRGSTRPEVLSMRRVVHHVKQAIGVMLEARVPLLVRKAVEQCCGGQRHWQMAART